MSENIFNKQINFGWGLTFDLTGKAPAINKRIFTTLSKAKEYANNYYDSAVEGLLLSVITDDDPSKNGVYFVEKIKSGINDSDAILTKIGSKELNSLSQSIEQKIIEINRNISKIESNCNASNEQINETIGSIESGKTVSSLLQELKNSIDECSLLINSNKNITDNYTINNKKISESPILESNDIRISNEYKSNNTFNDILTGDSLSIAISKLELALINTTLAFTATVNDLENKIFNLSEKIGATSEYDSDGNKIKESYGIIKRLEELENN
jgi:hypothetical protein